MAKKAIVIALISLLILHAFLMTGCDRTVPGKDENTSPNIIVYDKNIWSRQGQYEDYINDTDSTFINAWFSVFSKESDPVIELINCSGENVSDMKLSLYNVEDDPYKDFSYRGYSYSRFMVSFIPKAFPLTVDSLTYSVNGEEQTASFDPPLRCENIPDTDNPEIVSHSLGYGIKTQTIFRSNIPTFRFAANKDIKILEYDMNDYAHIKNAHIKGYTESNALIFEGKLDDMLPLFIASGTWFEIRFDCEFEDAVKADPNMSGSLEAVLRYVDVETGAEYSAKDQLSFSGSGNNDETMALIDTKLAELGIEKPAE